MKPISKIILAVLCAAVLALIIGFCYILSSNKYTTDFEAHMRMSLNAAAASTGVFVKTDDGYEELDPDSYIKLQYYLTLSPRRCFIDGSTSDESRELLIGSDTLTVTHSRVGSYENDAIVRFATLNKTYLVHVHGDDLWEDISYLTSESGYRVYEDESESGAD